MDSANPMWIFLVGLSLLEGLTIFSSLVFGRLVIEGHELGCNQYTIKGEKKKHCF